MKYRHIASAIERTMAAVQAIAEQLPSYRASGVHSPDVRVTLAEMNLELHAMRDHLDGCEDCEQP